MAGGRVNVEGRERGIRRGEGEGGPDLTPLTADLLRQGLAVRVRVTGGSMRPAIRSGDLVTIVPPERPPRAGDVVLVELPDGRPVLHRVYRAGGGMCRTRGDHLVAPDPPTPLDSVLGRAARVERPGDPAGTRSLATLAGRLGGRWRSLAGLLRHAAHRLRGRLRRWGTAAVAGALLLAPLVFAPPAWALKHVAPGQSLPPFVLPDLTGKTVSRDSLRGSPSVIIFWSTWSPRSAEALEDFKAYHREQGPRGLKVLAVNVDGEHLSAERKREIREYASRMDLPFPVLLDEDLAAFAAYGVMAHPSLVVAGPDLAITYLLGGYPLSLREELRDAFLALLGPPPGGSPPPAPAAPVNPPEADTPARRQHLMGMKLLSQGQTDRAREAFRRAAAEDPGYPDPAVMLARVSLSVGESGPAENLLAGLDREQVRRHDLDYLAGLLALRSGREGEAEAIFRGLLTGAPQQAWGDWGLGLLLLARNDVPGALAHLEKAAAASPVNVEAEALVKDFLRAAWRGGSPVPEEGRLVALFPSLGEMRNRYRNLFRMREGTP